jgi:hypothetical protein
VDADEIASICQVKYQYFRHLDLKEFDQLGELLTEGCSAAYDNGNLSFEGRASIIDFLSSSLSDAGIISEHHGHHPEITIDGPGSAHGVWYLEDRVLIPAADLEIGGTAFYEDRYEKVGEDWKIAATGYTRVFEEQRTFTTQSLISFSNRFSA